MKTARRFLTAATLGTCVLAGCSFGRFDSARDDVVVASFGSPTGGDGFGLVLATTSSPTTPGLLMVASKGTPSLARFEFTAAGKRNVTKYTSGDKDIDTGNGEFGAVAGTSSGDLVGAVGPDGTRQMIFINPQGVVNATPPAPQPAPNFGMAVTLADVYRPNVSPAADPSDFDGVVATSNEIIVYPDRGSRPVLLRCVTGASVSDAEQALTAGDVVTSNDGIGSKAEVVVGKPTKTGIGSVLITNLQPIANNVEDITTSVVFGAMCPSLVSFNAPGSEKSFGAKVVLGQVIGSDDLDLIVSAPSENVVYVFPGSPDGPLVANAIKIDAPAGASNPGTFGASIAVVDIDGDGKGEIAIGEPEATVSGKAGAGRVHMYNVSTGAPVKVGEPLSKHSPVGGQQFGSSVAALRVTPAGLSPRDELVVGTNNEVLVYFTTLYSIDMDERTK